MSKRLVDTRSGDVKEDFGVVLLRGFAAVVQVPRPDDTGLDAIATLMRRDGEVVIPEDTFYVQFKSEKVKTIAYEGEQVGWLTQLKLPFFIGRVSFDPLSLELFPTHGLSMQLISGPFEKIVLSFGAKRPRSPDPKVAWVEFEKPLVRINAEKFAKHRFTNFAYKMLKRYLPVEQRNIDYRPIRYFEALSWKTNVNVKPGAYMTAIQGADPDDTKRVFEQLGPFVHALYLRALQSKDRQLMEMVVSLVNYSRAAGHDPDPHSTYSLMLRQWNVLVVNRAQ